MQQFNTTVGNNNKDLKVDECSPHVLATVVDFIYGIGIPYDCSFEDARSLLAMADLYLMEDLKDAVGTLIATKLTSKHNILEVCELAERFNNKKLKKMCCDFIFQNLNNLDKKALTELLETLPMLGENALLELKLANHYPKTKIDDVASKVLGINQTNHFKKRGDFQSEDDYKGYVMARIEKNMVVVCNKRTRADETAGTMISEGTLGRVTSVDMKGPTVKWIGFSRARRGAFVNLDLLTPPVASSLFKD